MACLHRVFALVFVLSLCGPIQSVLTHGNASDLTAILTHMLSLQQTVITLQATTSNLESELQIAKTELEATKINLESTKKEIQTTKAELRSSKAEIATLQTNYTSVLSSQDKTYTSVSACLKQTGVLRLYVSAVAQTFHQEEASVKNEIHSMSSTVEDLLTEVNSSSWRINDVIKEVELLKSKPPKLSINDVKGLQEKISNIDEKMFDNEQNLALTAQDISKRLQNVAFQAYLSNRLRTQAHQAIKFNKDGYDAGNGYDVTTWKFTAPVSGTYKMWTQLEVLEKDRATRVNIVISGHTIASYTAKSSSDGSNIVASTSALTYLLKGQQVWVTTDDSLLVFGSSRRPSYFGGELMFVN